MSYSPIIRQPPQQSRRQESEATEYKLPLKQSLAGAAALCIAVILLVNIAALIGLQITLSVVVAWVALRALRSLYGEAWEFEIYNREDARVFHLRINSAALSMLLALGFCVLVFAVATLLFDVPPGSYVLEVARPLWLPMWFVEDWLIVFGRRILPAFGGWMRGTLTACALCVEFFCLNLAYRMAIEVFNPNWPPTFSAALAEWGPFWWLWGKDDETPEPAPQEIKVIETRISDKHPLRVLATDKASKEPSVAQGGGTRNGERVIQFPVHIADSDQLTALAQAIVEEGHEFSRPTGTSCGWSQPQWFKFREMMIDFGLVVRSKTPGGQTVYDLTEAGLEFLETQL